MPGILGAIEGEARLPRHSPDLDVIFPAESADNASYGAGERSVKDQQSGGRAENQTVRAEANESFRVIQRSDSGGRNRLRSEGLKPGERKGLQSRILQNAGRNRGVYRMKARWFAESSDRAADTEVAGDLHCLVVDRSRERGKSVLSAIAAAPPPAAMAGF